MSALRAMQALRAAFFKWRGKPDNVGSVNQLLSESFAGLIALGARFEADDLSQIGGWHASTGTFSSTEVGYYALAIAAQNTSYCLAWEAFYDRRPWRWPGPVSVRTAMLRKYRHIHPPDFTIRHGERLSADEAIQIDGVWWRVTALGADEIRMVAYVGDDGRFGCPRASKGSKRASYSREEWAEMEKLEKARLKSSVIAIDAAPCDDDGEGGVL